MIITDLKKINNKIQSLAAGGFDVIKFAHEKDKH